MMGVSSAELMLPWTLTLRGYLFHRENELEISTTCLPIWLGFCSSNEKNHW